MSQLQLHRFYQNARGASINAGVYDIVDHRLHGLGAYLLESGFASLIEDTLPVVEASLDSDSTDELEALPPLADDFEAPVVEDPAPSKRKK